MGWERETLRLGQSTAGTVTIDTLDSNLRRSGQRLALPGDPGRKLARTSTVDVEHGRPSRLLGRVVGALIPIAGARTLGKQFQSVLRNAETR